jgi:RsiW-degrading membrane proteinase PrsW (M82 family)
MIFAFFEFSLFNIAILMIVYPKAMSQSVFELAFKAGPVVEPLKAEAILFVLAIHGDLELLLIRELPEVASQAIHPVSLENLSAK